LRLREKLLSTAGDAPTYLKLDSSGVERHELSTACSGIYQLFVAAEHSSCCCCQNCKRAAAAPPTLYVHILVIAGSSFLILLFPPLAALFPVQEEEDVFGWWCPCTRWILEFRCSTLGIVGNSFVKLCSDVPIAASIAKCKLLILFILRPVR
jgi:hypothetical protein